MNDLVASGLGWLFDLYVLASILLISAAAVNAAVKQPSRRIAVSWAALVGVGIFAIATLLPLGQRINLELVTIARSRPNDAKPVSLAVLQDVIPTETLGSDLSSTRNLNQTHIPNVSSNLSHRGTTTAANSNPSALTVDHEVARYFVFAFVTVGFAVSLWMSVGCFQAVRIVRRSKSAPECLQVKMRKIAGPRGSVPRLRISDQLGEPAAAGLFRPLVLMPSNFVCENDDRAIEAAMSHELTHIRRYDLWMLAICRWLMVVLFAHPAYWWLRRQVRVDQEFLADAAASNHLTPVAYAEFLVDWSRKHSCSRRLSGIMATMIGNSLLKQRIAVLLDQDMHVDHASSGRWNAGMTMLVGVFVVALSSFTLSAISVDDDGKANTFVAKSAIPIVTRQSFAAADSLDDAHAQPMVVYSERRKRQSAPKVRLTVQNNHALRAPLIAHLTCDITLELVGVRQHSSAGAGWWKPDGSIVNNNTGGAATSDTVSAPEVVILVRNPNDVPLDWKLDRSNIRLLERDPAASNYSPSDGQLIAVALPASGRTADFRLRVGVGTWETRGGSKSASNAIDGHFTFSLCNDSDDLVVVSVEHPIEKEEIQLVAVDSSGCQHHPVNFAPSHGALTASFSELPLERIDEFRVQTRQQRCVEFRNVSLTPGRLTDVQMNVCGIRDPNERGHAAL